MLQDQAEAGNYTLSGRPPFCSGRCGVPPRPPPGRKVLSPSDWECCHRQPWLGALMGAQPKAFSGQPSSIGWPMPAYKHKCLTTTWDNAEGPLHLQSPSWGQLRPSQSASQPNFLFYPVLLTPLPFPRW